MTVTLPLRRILCATDLSDASRHALEQAAAIASWYHAALTVVHVYHPAFVPVPGLPPVAERVPPGELERTREEATAWVRRAAPEQSPADVVLEVGHAADQILARAISIGADVLVIGTHGAGGFQHLLLGSVAEKVLRKATCPVLTVPPHVRATSNLPFRRVLCAVDFSDWSLSALKLAESFAIESGAALTALHVIEWPWHEPPAPALSDLPADQAKALSEFRRYLCASATARLEAIVSDTVAQRCGATVRIAHGKPYMEILRTARDEQADLIALGVHGRTRLDLAVFGSTTNQVVRQATCPVLTLRG